MRSFGRLVLATVVVATLGVGAQLAFAEEGGDGGGETIDCLKVAEGFNTAIQTIIDGLPDFTWSGNGDRLAYVLSVLPERIDARCVQTVSASAKAVFEPMDERNRVATRFGWSIYTDDYLSVFVIDIPFRVNLYVLQFGILNSGSIAGVYVHSHYPYDVMIHPEY